MAIADGSKEEKTIHAVWIVFLAALYIPLHKLIGLKEIGWVIVPLVIYLVTFFTKSLCNSIFDRCFIFMGKISLESYLVNIALNGLLVLLIPAYYSSTFFYGRYLEYSIVIVLGTLLAAMANSKSQLLLNKK